MSQRSREGRLDLPDGYAGVVLRTPDNKMGKGLASGCRKKEEEKLKFSGGTTRRSKRGQEQAKVEDEVDAPGRVRRGSDTRSSTCVDLLLVRTVEPRHSSERWPR